MACMDKKIKTISTVKTNTNTLRVKKYTKIFSIISLNLALVLLITPLSTNAISTTIQITRAPFLSFINIPDSITLIENQPVPVQDTVFISDSNVAPPAVLPTSRYLTVQDTRNSGGLKLQIEAAAFYPPPVPPNTSLNNNFRIITSTADAVSGVNVTELAGIKYYGEDSNNFVGPANIVAPLNTAVTNFTDPSIYTQAPFNDGRNILLAETPVDLMQGCLPSSQGRSGLMHLSTSFYLMIPKFTAPNDYYTTLTYTLMDDTDNCS
jgi:hypothetical protein